MKKKLKKDFFFFCVEKLGKVRECINYIAFRSQGRFCGSLEGLQIVFATADWISYAD